MSLITIKKGNKGYNIYNLQGEWVGQIDEEWSFIPDDDTSWSPEALKEILEFFKSKGLNSPKSKEC